MFNSRRVSSMISSPPLSSSSSLSSPQPLPPTFLDAETLSKADPSEIAKVISSVLFANVKAKQIVQAAAQVKSQFRGVVPESQHSLKMITGIGPKLAEVLHHVNCREHYKK
mmetsp:Transcript_5838/g.8765  ORF Transcript_5838/g.8765 Transcript_5838/m.8765 type:complete len:111 (+) Transcript_5838:298-630(+)